MRPLRRRMLCLCSAFLMLSLMFFLMDVGAAEEGTAGGAVEEQKEPQGSDAALTVEIADDADLLSDGEEKELLFALQELSAAADWACFAITANDTKGLSTQAYADDFVDTHAFEQDGVCFLIDMQHRQVYIATTGEAIRYLTDERIERVLDEGYDELTDGDYAGCFLSMTEKTEDYYDAGIPRNQYNEDAYGNRDYYRNRRKELTWVEALIALVIALGAAGGFAAVVMGKYRLKFSTYRYDFFNHSSLHLSDRKDVQVNEFVTRQRIQEQSSSGRNRSSTHVSRGGGTHGGGGRSF